MKKIFSLCICFICLFLLLFTGCTDSNKINPEPSDSTSPSSELPNNTDPSSPIGSQKPKPDGYLIGRRNFADKDENGDIYFITTKHVGKIDASGEVSILCDGFQFGHDIAVHNQWIYTLRGRTLYRTDKNGENEYEYPLLSDYPVNSIYIYENVLYADITNKDGHVEYYYADITDDPDTLEFMPESDKFDRESFIRQAGLDFPEKSLEEFEEYTRVHTIAVTDEYAYFYTVNNEFGRLNKKTQQAELLPIKPHQVEKTTVIDGWIYYIDVSFTDSSCTLYRTSEDLSKTEKIYQDSLNTLN